MRIIINHTDGETEILELEDKKKTVYQEDNHGIVRLFYDDELVLIINLKEVRTVRFEE